MTFSPKVRSKVRLAGQLDQGSDLRFVSSVARSHLNPIVKPARTVATLRNWRPGGPVRPRCVIGRARLRAAPNRDTRRRHRSFRTARGIAMRVLGMRRPGRQRPRMACGGVRHVKRSGLRVTSTFGVTLGDWCTPARAANWLWPRSGLRMLTFALA